MRDICYSEQKRKNDYLTPHNDGNRTFGQSERRILAGTIPNLAGLPRHRHRSSDFQNSSQTGIRYPWADTRCNKLSVTHVKIVALRINECCHAEDVMSSSSLVLPRWGRDVAVVIDAVMLTTGCRRPHWCCLADDAMSNVHTCWMKIRRQSSSAKL